MCPLPPEPPSYLPFPSRLSQSTSFGCPSSYIKLPLAIYFTCGNVYVSGLFSRVIPHSPTVSQSLFSMSVWKHCSRHDLILLNISERDSLFSQCLLEALVREKLEEKSIFWEALEKPFSISVKSHT